MKRSTILCASVVAVLLLTPHGAFASINYSASKSNTGNIFTFDQKVDLNGPKLCSDAGGTVKTGPGKLSTCVVPKKAGPAKAN
jgi:hypothetical protein